MKPNNRQVNEVVPIEIFLVKYGCIWQGYVAIQTGLIVCLYYIMKDNHTGYRN